MSLCDTQDAVPYFHDRRLPDPFEASSVKTSGKGAWKGALGLVLQLVLEAQH